jgi:hypothetical protein
VFLQVGGTRVEVEVEFLTADFDRREEKSSIVLGVGGNRAGLLSSSSARLSGGVCGPRDGNEVVLDNPSVLPEDLPHGSGAIGTSGMSRVQLARDLERALGQTTLAQRRGSGKHKCCQKSEKENESCCGE